RSVGNSHDLDSWLEKYAPCWLELNSLNSADTKRVQLNALESALTILKDLIPFRICTYEKNRGRGTPPARSTLTRNVPNLRERHATKHHSRLRKPARKARRAFERRRLIALRIRRFC